MNSQNRHDPMHSLWRSRSPKCHCTVFGQQQERDVKRFVYKVARGRERQRDLIGGEGSSGEGVALAAANLALLTPASQDLVDVLLSKGFFLLLGFLFFSHLQ